MEQKEMTWDDFKWWEHVVYGGIWMTLMLAAGIVGVVTIWALTCIAFVL